MKTKALLLPPLVYLHECFELSDKSPSGLIWKERPRHHFSSDQGQKVSNTRFAGKIAGNVMRVRHSKDLAYWRVELSNPVIPTKRIGCAVHRVVYSLRHGVVLDPNIQIDHKNHDGLDNTDDNLRLASASNNTQNARTRKDNSSGIKGVSWNKNGKYWWGQLNHRGERHVIRGCPTSEKCAELLTELREKLHKEFTHHG